MEIILKYFTDLSDLQLAQLRALEHLYKEWNSKINVISRKDIDGLYEKHVLHSLSIAAVFDFAAGTEIIDIGTGGGFPGIPLAIFFPNVRFHLIDSVGKKLKVVESVAGLVGLGNVTIQQIRAEEMKGRKFDFALSRAVAPLKELWSWSKPLLRNPKLGSGLICLKGGDLASEIKDSGTKPRIIEIFEIFAVDYFREKYILYIPKVSSQTPL